MIGQRIPPPLYALATAALIWLGNRYAPLLPIRGWPRSLLGWGLVAIGVSLPASAIGCLLRARTTINPVHPERATRLVVRGPYRLSRNPMYLGLVCSLLGWGILLGSLLWLVLVWGFTLVVVKRQIIPEEATLATRFGAPYHEYLQRVNRWIGWRRRAGGIT